MSVTLQSASPAENGDPLGALAESLWRPMGVDGVYGRTGAYETIVGNWPPIFRKRGTRVPRCCAFRR